MPWPQKGADVTLPLGTSAPITGFGKETTGWQSGSKTVYETQQLGTTPASSTWSKFQETGSATADKTWFVEEDPDNAGYPNIRADLTEATSATINQLRLFLPVLKKQVHPAVQWHQYKTKLK